MPKIAVVKPAPEVDPKARYTVTLLRDAPNPANAEKFLTFLLGQEGRDLLQKHGLDLVKPPGAAGDVQAIPASLQALLKAAQ